MRESISTIIPANGVFRSYAEDVLLFDVGVGTVTLDVGARRGAIVVDVFVVVGAVGVGASSTMTKDGVVVVEGAPKVEFDVVGDSPVIGATCGGVGAGVSNGAVTVVGVRVESVSLRPAVKVHVSGQFFIEMHSHSNGNVMNSSPNSNTGASSVKLDVSHISQAVKLSILGRHGELIKSAAIHVTEPTPVKFNVLSTGGCVGISPTLNVQVLGQSEAVEHSQISGMYTVERPLSYDGKRSVVKLHENTVLIEQSSAIPNSHGCAS